MRLAERIEALRGEPLIDGKSVEKVNYTEATWITKENADSVVVK